MEKTTKNYLQDVQNELEKRGYVADTITVSKNGISKTGICVGDGATKPTFYPAAGRSTKEIADEIISQLSRLPQIDTTLISNWEYAKDNLRLCIQRKTDENILKRDYLDLELYVRVELPSNICSGGGMTASFKIVPGMFNVDEDEIFRRALETAKEKFVVRDMRDELGILLSDDPSKYDMPDSPDAPCMLVASYGNKINGAAVICDTDLLRNVAQKYDSDILIIPSSIHECILVVNCDQIQSDMASFDFMVQEVNNSEVDEEERLSDHVYVYRRDTGKIVY